MRPTLKTVLSELAAEPVALHMDAVEPCLARLQAASRLDETRLARSEGGVAVIGVRGMILSRPSLLEELGFGISVPTLRRKLEEHVESKSTKAVVLDIDSPGGSSRELAEFSEAMRQMRGVKPIIAQGNHLIASAAYWIASQASEIMASKSSEVGSIGVYMVHWEESRALEQDGITPTIIKAGRYKAEGNPWEPLTEETRTYFQGLVDELYVGFVRDIAAGRGTSADRVRSQYGEGRVLRSEKALEAGMIDRVRSLEETFTALGVGAGRGSGSRSRMRALSTRLRELELAEL